METEQARKHRNRIISAAYIVFALLTSWNVIGFFNLNDTPGLLVLFGLHVLIIVIMRLILYQPVRVLSIGNKLTLWVALVAVIFYILVINAIMIIIYFHLYR